MNFDWPLALYGIFFAIFGISAWILLDIYNGLASVVIAAVIGLIAFPIHSYLESLVDDSIPHANQWSKSRVDDFIIYKYGWVVFWLCCLLMVAIPLGLWFMFYGITP